MTTLAAFVCCTMMMANPVGPAAARQAAAKFLQAKGAELKNEAIQAPRRAMGHTAHGQQSQEASPYYVFNASKGFVVVSGDDCVGDNLVLGYTDNGSFDASNVPVNMQDWLDAMASQIASLSRRGMTTRAITLYDDVAPLLTTTWGQGDYTFNPNKPYNALCPEVDGQLSCTGCMATALSQVLNYHRWPQEPIGELVGYKTYTTKVDIAPLPGVKFDWDNMLDNYNGETTEEQQMAVATLMRYCGQLLQMDYTPELSNAFAYDMDLLIRQFGFDQGIHQERSPQYSVNDWISMLYTELKEKRPLLYGGFSQGGGHAFVIDGYQVEDGVGYFHVNWGWDGESNGYYRIDVLNPNGSGTGGSATSDGYCIEQNALIGFQPAKSALENYCRYLDDKNWNIYYNDEPHYFSAFNSSYMPGNFSVAMAERLADGTIDYDHLLGEHTIAVAGYTYGGFQTDGNEIHKFFQMPDHVADGLTPGSHRLVFVNKEEGIDAPWLPLFGTNCSIEIIINDKGQPTDTIYHPQPKLSCTEDDITATGLGGLDEMMMYGLQQIVTATITNSSDDAFTGNMSCTLYPVVNDVLGGYLKYYETALFVEANGKADISFAICPPGVGKLVAVITDDDVDYKGMKLSELKNDPDYIGHKIITANELKFYIHNFAYETYTKDEETKARFAVNVGNYTALDYNSYLMAKIYKPDSDGNYQLMTFNGNEYQYDWVNIGVNQRKDVYIDLDQVLEPGEYGVDFYISFDYVGNKYSDYFFIASRPLTVAETTAIKSVDSDQPTDAGKWFSLDGRRLDSRPATKGVYVRQGKKFVVK